MKAASITAALIALMTGLVAAYNWYRASDVTIDLGYLDPSAAVQTTYRRGGLELPRQPQSGCPDLQRINEISAMWDAANEAAKLNKIAALWTAASVFSGALASVLGAL